MAFLGVFRLDVDSVVFYAQTSTPATGAETDADAVPSYRVYEDETTPPLLTGNMALLDDANTVGWYSEQIAVTVGNGFEAGKTYCVRKRALMATVPGAEFDTFRVTARGLDDLAQPGDPMNTTQWGGVAVGGMPNSTTPPAMITAQQIRDAMKLAPTGGFPGAGSVDTHLDTIESRAMEIPVLSYQGIRDAMKLMPSMGAPEADSIDKKLDGVAVPGDPMSLTVSERATLYTGIWSYAERTVTGLGSLLGSIAQSVWAHYRRTLTKELVTAATPPDSEEIEIIRGDTFTYSLTGMGDLSNCAKIWFTVKTSADDADRVALIYANSDEGLVYLNAAEPTDPSGASITIEDILLGNATIVVHHAQTAKLVKNAKAYYDIQAMFIDDGGSGDGGEDTTIVTWELGTCKIRADVTRATT